MDCKCWKAVTASCGEDFSEEQGKKLQNGEFGLNKWGMWFEIFPDESGLWEERCRGGKVSHCLTSECLAPACWWSFPPCYAPRLGWKILKWSSRDGLDAVRFLRGCCVCPTYSGAMSRHFCSVTVLHMHGKLMAVSSGGSLHSWQEEDTCCLHLRMCLCHPAHLNFLTKAGLWVYYIFKWYSALNYHLHFCLLPTTLPFFSLIPSSLFSRQRQTFEIWHWH